MITVPNLGCFPVTFVEGLRVVHEDDFRPDLPDDLNQTHTQIFARGKFAVLEPKFDDGLDTQGSSSLILFFAAYLNNIVEVTAAFAAISTNNQRHIDAVIYQLGKCSTRKEFAVIWMRRHAEDAIQVDRYCFHSLDWCLQ